MTNEKMLKMVNKMVQDGNYLKIALNLKDELENDIRKDVLKSKGVTPKQIKLIEKMFKKVDDNTHFKNKYSEFDDKYWFTDSYRLYGSNEKFGYKAMEEPLNIERIYQPQDAKIKIVVDIKDLQAFIKIHKNEKISYILENENIKIGFNPVYLLEGLQFCETDTIKCSRDVYPAYIENAQGDSVAIVFPIRLK